LTQCSKGTPCSSQVCVPHTCLAAVSLLARKQLPSPVEVPLTDFFPDKLHNTLCQLTGVLLMCMQVVLVWASPSLLTRWCRSCRTAAGRSASRHQPAQQHSTSTA
jgi:hypothetical protein